MISADRQFCVLHAAIFFVLIMMNAALSFLVIGQEMHWIFKENGFLENAQVGLLFIACVVFLVASFKLSGRHKFIAYFFAQLSFIFIIREVDFDRIAGMPDIAVFFLAEKGRAVFFTALFVLLAFILKDIKHYWGYLSRYLASSFTMYLGLSAFSLVVLSYLFEKKISGQYHIFFEELAEVSAYYFMVVAALLLVSALQKIDASIAQRHSESD